MAKSKESFNKKDKEKQRLKKRQDKADKMDERRKNASGGKSLEDMLAYVDENGNLSDTPPDGRKKTEINPEDIQLGAAPITPDEAEALRSGTVESFFEDKGFGFIRDDRTKESIFVHAKQLQEPIGRGDKVTYQTERTPKGISAITVRKK